MEAAGIPEEKWWRYRELCNRLGNLELLLPHENEAKSAKDFGEWLRTRGVGFRDEHLIPDDDELLDFRRFEEFVEARESLIRERLGRLFSVEHVQEVR